MTVRWRDRVARSLVRGVFVSSRRPRRGGPAWGRGWRRRLRRRRRPGARAGIAAERLEQRLHLAADLWPTASITVLPAAEGQPGDTIRWSVAFTEPVTGVDVSDFRLVAGSGVATTTNQLAVSGSGDAYVVTATRVLGVGTLGLNLVDNGSIRDSTGNLLRSQSTVPSFTVGEPVATGGGGTPGSEGVKAADLNGDGILDLVASGSWSNNVHVLLGKGDGTFSRTTTINLTGSVGAIDVGDLDGDGDTDVVVASPSQKGVNVLLNRGNGTFAAPVSYGTFYAPISIRLADLDADGKTDIVAALSTRSYSARFGTTREAQEYIGVLKGIGDGAFQAVRTIWLAGQVNSIVTGDFTGDGRSDVIVAMNNQAFVTVIRNTGSLTSFSMQNVQLGGSATVMAAGDIDGDGKLDVAFGQGTGTITVLLGNGDGTFQPRKSVPTRANASSVELRDVTSDGNLDLIVTLPTPDKMAVLAGRGDGTFGIPQEFATPSDPGSLAIGDFNRDGRADIAIGIWNGAVAAALNAANGNVSGAVASVSVTAPPAPTNLVVSRGDRQVALAWDAPATNGGTALTGYVVQTSEDGGTTWKSTPRTLADGRQLTVTGLSNGASYLFRVAAVNAAGIGTYTAPSEAVKPVGFASAPQNVAGTAGDGRVDLTWSLPATTGGEITNYVAEYRTASGTGSGSWTAFARPVSTARAAAVTGLVNGREYLFRVAAVNSLGQGAYATTTTPLVPKTTPGSVTGLAAVAGNGVIDVSWAALSAGATGGSAVTGYLVEYKTSAAEVWTQLTPVSASATTVRVSGLVNGTSYVYRVAATNAVGAGSFTSGPAAVTPFQPASAPTITSVTASTGQVTVSWSLPASDGGSEITDYTVQYRPTSAVAWTTVSRAASTDRSAAVAGLVNGSSYVFRVAAVSAAGTGDWSAASAAATPFGAPQMTGVVAGAGNGRASLSWSPALANGSPVTNYVVEYRTNLSDANAWIPVVRPATTETWIAVTGLSNGVNHQFRVAAVNAAGASAWSPSATVLPNVAPAAPSGVSATARNGGASLSWTAPAPNGGTAISSYVIQYRAAVSTQWITFGRTPNATPSATVTGLVNGLGYSFRVAAVNQQGAGNYSDESAAVTPAASVAPTVVGVTLRGTPDFGASQVGWDVTFSEPVTGVNAADFTAVTGGLTKVGSLTVDGSGSAYVVTASGITGAGTVGLNLLDDGSIRNAAGGRLSQSGTTAFQQTNMTMGSLPMSLAVADVNGDGRPDLITANDGNRTVSVRLALSNGSYQAATSYTVGANPRGVVVADVNLDGRPDIVVANRGSNTVSVLRGGGNGSFTVQPQIPAGSAPSAVVVADLNLDGLPDLVVTNPMSGAVSILAGVAGGAFQARRAVTTGGTPNSLAAGDVNRDGRPDIVVADSNGSTVGVLIGKGNLTFQATQPFSAGTRPDGVRLEDLDGDGQLDVVVANTQSGTVSVLKGNGNGGFHSRVSYAVDASPASIAVADVDGDTRPDLVVTNPFGSAASVLLSDGAGGFLAKRALTSGGFPAAAAAADFNADGRPDLAVVDAFLPGVKLFMNTLNGATTGAVAALAPLPGDPTLAAVTGGNARAVLSWEAGSDGGVPITNYVIQRRSGGGEWAEVARPVSTATSATVAGLTNGTTYEFRVAAVTAIGRGDFSEASSVTPAPVVPEYVIPQSVVAGNGQATVSWHAPADDGGSPVTDYVVQYKSGSADWTTFVREPSTARSVVVTGLTNGATYVFRFAAVNAVGTGEFSAPGLLVSPYTLPDALASAPVATSGNTSVTLSWGAPLFDGGATITNYLIESSTDGGATWTPVARPASSATTATLTGLVNGTSYLFRVAPVNFAGAGPFAGAAAAVVPAPVAPGAPGTTLARAGNQRATLTWASPTSDGGAPIMTYDIEYSTNGGSTWLPYARNPSAATSAVVTGLLNGGSYRFRVAAVNAAGRGPFSGSSLAVVPALMVSSDDPMPYVAGIVLTAPVSPNATSISWTVTFSEPVTGVNANDFVLVKTGTIATATAVTVMGTGAAYTVTATGVTGAGTLGLNLIDDGSIRDGGGRPLTNRGVPPFTSVVFAPSSTSNQFAERLVAADINGDDRIDLVHANGAVIASGPKSIDIRYGDGAGAFPTTASIPFGAVPRDVAVQDVDGDGRPDLVVLGEMNHINTVRVRKANEDGTFQAEQAYAVSNVLSGGRMTVVDLDLDGKPEVLVQHYSSITILRNDGTGVFTTSSIAVPTTHVAVADVTGDDVPDLITLGSQNFVHRGHGDGSFQAPQAFAGPSGPLAVADLDRDGFQDLAIVDAHSMTGQKTGMVSLMKGNGAGQFTLTGRFFAEPSSFGMTHIIVVDFNGDGLLDIGCGSSILLGQGDGTFLSPRRVLSASSNLTYESYFFEFDEFAALADFDGDGRVDLAQMRESGAYSTKSGVYFRAAANYVGATAAIGSVASAPRNLTARLGDTHGQGGFTWAAPESTGGSAITGYIIQQSLDGGATWSDLATKTSPVTYHYTESGGITRAYEYSFRVAAVTAAGTGAFSAATTPETPKGEPELRNMSSVYYRQEFLSATAGPGQATLSWRLQWDGGRPVTDYRIRYSSNGGSTWTNVSRSASTEQGAVVTGLTNGTAYIFQVAAINAAPNPGDSIRYYGSYDERGLPVTVTPKGLPGAPTGVTATGLNGEVRLAWTAPVVNTATTVRISGYDVSRSADSGATWTTTTYPETATSAMFGSLVNGTEYRFKVAAKTSSFGNGTESAAITATPSASPYVTAIGLVGGATTAADSVSWEVTFSQPVIGVDASDFTLATASVTTSAPLGVAGSGATYTVTATGLSGTGTIGLNLVDNGTIRNANGQRLVTSGAAAFGTSRTVTVGSGLRVVTGLDSNFDGKLDLVTVNSPSTATNSLSTALGNGDGTLQPATTSTPNSFVSNDYYATGIVKGDFNRDGRIDVAVTYTPRYSSRQFGWVGVFLGASSGGLSYPDQYEPYVFGAGDGGTTSLAAGDLNGDGSLDLVVANSGGTTVIALFGAANGTFGRARAFTVGSGPSGVAVADVDGDGDLDIVVTRPASGVATILPGNGNGTFQAAQSIAVGADARSLVLADLNADGRLDIAVANSPATGSGTVSVLLGNADGTYQSRSTYAVGARPTSLIAADVNGDGRPDLAVVNAPSSGSGTVSLLVGVGNGNFLSQQTVTVGNSPSWLATADLDGDGRLELIVANGHLTVLPNATVGTFTGQVATRNNP